MRKRGRLWVFLLLVPVIGCGVLRPPTDDQPPVEETATPLATEAPTAEPLHAKVRDVINAVLAAPLAEDEERAAEAGMLLYLGGYVRAEEASTARVQLDEEKLVRVAPNTTFTFQRYDEDGMTLELGKGQMWLDVQGVEEGQTIEVETPAAAASVRGTRFGVRVGLGGETLVSTKVGTVTVRAQGRTVAVGAGRQTLVTPGDAPMPPAPLTPEEQMRWGMAVGEAMSVTLPIVDHTGVFTYAGFPLSRDWSPDGRYFVHTYFDGAPQHVFYDVQTQAPVASPLPPQAGGIFFSPAGDSIAYQLGAEGKYQICTTGYTGSLARTGPASCAGPLCSAIASPALAVDRQASCFGGDALYGWPFWSPDGESILLYSDRAQGGARAPRPGQGEVASLARAAQPGVGFDLFKVRPDGSELVQLTSEPGYEIRQAWSPDGEWIAFVRTDEYNAPGDVWVMRADGSEAQMVFEGIYGNGFSHLAWSPDGQHVAVPASGGTLWIVPVEGGEARLVPGTAGLACQDPAWAPTEDGWPLFFQVSDEARGGLWIYMPSVAAEAWRLADMGWGPSWSPVGAHIASAFADMEDVSVHLFATEPGLWP